MPLIIKNIQVNWSWSGDTEALKGFNVCLCKSTDTPLTATTAFVYISDINSRSYIFRNITIDTGVTYEPYVQAVYDGKDSDWVKTSGGSIADDGINTIPIKSQVDTAATTATWDGITGKPDTLNPPIGSGLYLSSTRMGYYDTGAWKTYIDNTGKFQFYGDANNYIDWNITTANALTIKGQVHLKSDIVGAPSITSPRGALIGNSTGDVFYNTDGTSSGWSKVWHEKADKELILRTKIRGGLKAWNYVLSPTTTAPVVSGICPRFNESYTGSRQLFLYGYYSSDNQCYVYKSLDNGFSVGSSGYIMTTGIGTVDIFDMFSDGYWYPRFNTSQIVVGVGKYGRVIYNTVVSDTSTSFSSYQITGLTANSLQSVICTYNGVWIILPRYGSIGVLRNASPQNNTWTNPSAPPSQITDWTNLAANSTTVMALGYDSVSGYSKVWKSTDDGLTWTLANINFPQYSYNGSISYSNGKWLVSFSISYSGIGVASSVDGVTWEVSTYSVNIGVAGISGVIDFIDDETGKTVWIIFAETSQSKKIAIFSIDNGATWEVQALSLPRNSPSMYKAIKHPEYNGVLIPGGSYSLMWRSAEII